MNASSDDEGNNYKVYPDPPKNDVNINANTDDEKNDYEVTPDNLQMAEILKQLKMTKKKITKKMMRRKQTINNLIRKLMIRKLRKLR